MMTFKEFREHKDGTFVRVDLCKEDGDTLYNWCVDNGISNPLDKSEYHATVIYSKTPCPAVTDHDFKLPITGTISGWKIFDAGIGRCLVAAIQSEELQTINAELKLKYGATSDFPEYIPHVTVSYNYVGSMPDNYPAMKVSFDSITIKGLDLNWRPNKN